MLKKIFLIFMLFASMSFAYTPSDFFILNHTETGFGYGCSYYTATNPTIATITATGSNALGIESWIEEIGELKTSYWEKMITTQYNLSVWQPDIICETLGNGTERCTDNGRYITETKYKSEWQILDTTSISFLPLESKPIRVCGTFDMNISKDGSASVAIEHIPKFMGYVFDGISAPRYDWFNATYSNSLQARIENPLGITVYNKTFKIILNSSYQDYYADNCSDLVVVAEDNITVMQYGIYLCKQNMSRYAGTENETHILLWNYTWDSGNTTVYIYMNASGVSSRAVNLSEANNVTLRYDDFEDGTANTESKSSACSIDSTSKLIGTNTILCDGTTAGLILVFNFTGHSTGNATAEYFLLHNTTSDSCGHRTAFTDSGNNTLKNILYSGAVNGAQCNFQGWRYYSGSYLAYPAPAPPDLDPNPRFIQLYFSNDTTQRLGENRTYYGNITMNTNSATRFKIDTGTSTLTHTYYLDELVVYNSLNNTAYTVYLGVIGNGSSDVYFTAPSPPNNTANFTYPLVFNMTDTANNSFSSGSVFEIDGTNYSCTLASDNKSCSYTLTYAQHIFGNNYTVKGFGNISGTIYETNETRYVPYYGCGYVNSNWCYQETATVATACGGLATGDYRVVGTWSNPANLNDTDWGTYANTTELSEYFINYTKPTDATSAYLQVKTDGGSMNISMTPIWDAYADRIRIEIIHSDIFNSYLIYGDTGGGLWSLLQGGLGTTDFYEEAMWWNVGNNTMQGNVSISNSTCFTINASNINFDGAGYDISGTYIPITLTYGFYSDHFNDSIIKNLSIHGFYDGIYTINNSNLNITNITSYNNSRYGVRLLEGNTNYISYSIFHTNNIGLNLESQQDSTFFNLTIYNNSVDGFVMGEANSQNNLIYNSISHSNNISSTIGFNLYQSTNLTLRDNIAYGNLYGAWIAINNSLIYNNNFYNNSDYQFYINSGYGSGDNTIYNNIFNATNSTQNITYDECTNYWNTTQTTATNIIGGASIGGNYYSDVSCVDEDFDGICDNPDNYTGTTFVDYLPLTYLNASCLALINITNIYQNTTTDTLSVGDTILYAYGNITINNTCSLNITNYNLYIESTRYLNDSNANSSNYSFIVNLPNNTATEFENFNFEVPLTQATSDGDVGAYSHFHHPIALQYTFSKNYTRNIYNTTTILPYPSAQVGGFQLYRCNQTSCNASDSADWSESLEFTYDTTNVTRTGDNIDDLVYIISYDAGSGGGGGGGGGYIPPSNVTTPPPEAPPEVPTEPISIEEYNEQFTEENSRIVDWLEDITDGEISSLTGYTCDPYLTRLYGDKICGVKLLDLAVCEWKGIISLYIPRLTHFSAFIIWILVLIAFAIANRKKTDGVFWGLWALLIFTIIQGANFIVFLLTWAVSKIQEGIKFEK